MGEYGEKRNSEGGQVGLGEVLTLVEMAQVP